METSSTVTENKMDLGAHNSPLFDFLQLLFHLLLSDLLSLLNLLPWYLLLCHFLFPFLLGGRGGKKSSILIPTPSLEPDQLRGRIILYIYTIKESDLVSELPCATQRSRASVGHQKGCQYWCSPADETNIYPSLVPRLSPRPDEK